MEGLQINVLNMSKIQWSRNNWGVGAGQSDEVNWTDEVSQTPLEVLPGHNYSTSAAASTIHLSGLVKDALYMRLGYGCEEGSFAVMLQQQFHMFGIGKQDRWLHWDKAWSDPTTDTAAYVWTFATCKVVATPSLTDTGGTIGIVISDLVKKPA